MSLFSKSRGLRPFFDPRGVIRRIERAGSHFLTQKLYPWLPGFWIPYSWILRRQLTLSSTTVTLPGLPQSFDGLRVLMVSDIHAGPFVSRRTLFGAIERLMTVEPDLIVLPGDMVSARHEEIELHREAFALLRAPLGCYAVLGNHDHYTRNVPRVIDGLGQLGIEVLMNRSIHLERNGERLCLAGVDDMLMGEPDLEAALSQATSPTVLLSHNPDMLFDASRRDVELVLSGHTHAGQVRLPGLPVLVPQSRYRLDEGRYRHRATELIVSRGIGAVGVPLRTFCPPEAIVLTLKRSRA